MEIISQNNFFKKLKGTALKNEGFTLTEMLIVIALIALIGTFVTGNLMSKYERSKQQSTKIQIKQLGVILDDFKRECGFYPTTEQGLDALIHKPTGGRECKNYDPEGYIKGKSIPRDGWDGDFLYESDGSKYKLTSLGSDKKPGGDAMDKDISSDDVE